MTASIILLDSKRPSYEARLSALTSDVNRDAAALLAWLALQAERRDRGEGA